LTSAHPEEEILEIRNKLVELFIIEQKTLGGVGAQVE
jgi:hypothetical protein